MEKIILFTKYPKLGKVKTRLVPEFGDEKATKIHCELVDICIEKVLSFKKQRNIQFTVYYNGADEEQMRSWLTDVDSFEKQSDGDLGEKMSKAFEKSFSQGFKRVLIIGSDCPYITHAHLNDALNSLNKCPIVWGPTYDGGYYTIALSQMIPDLFKGISWSTPSVLEQSLKKASDLNLEYRLLEKLNDIDMPQDYRSWKT